MIRVLVVDDSAFVRQAVSRMLGSAPDIEVVGTAADGREALEKVARLRPDVVTLDLKMPRMGGLEALKRIMSDHPLPVLLLSSLTREGADVTMRALELGAMDFVDKSRVQGHMELLSLAGELQNKVRALAGISAERLAQLDPAAPVRTAPAEDERAEVVAIGTSTGGPSALQAIVPRLPAGLPSCILVVQHMPEGFTRSLAERLDARSALEVREAQDGDPVTAGSVLIAPGGRHMKVRRRGAQVRVWLDEEPRSAVHRPSVDVLMGAVAKVFGRRAMGILLTGMGNDGVEGLRAIRAAGGKTLAESEDSCVIYGMPRAAVEAGVVGRSLPLGRMAEAIVGAV